ncbi:hypothetical protein [Bradyrhizobium sp.]|uniref:hypothetical protein n=1 Tax=Bradyrhizobium sp. TaxID=376 RepID=UPI004038116F
MRVVAAAVIVAFLAGPAFGQAQQPVQRYGEPDKEKTAQEIRAEKEAEAAYRRSLGNIPAQKQADPWGNVRSDAKPEAKTPEAKTSPAKKTKTGAN